MSIRIASDKLAHGRCFYCERLKPLVVCLPGAMDKQPCEDCSHYMTRGVIFISVRDGEIDGQTPFRTGGFAVLTSDAACRILGTDMLVEVLAHRFCYVEDSIWTKLGLPRHQTKAARRAERAADASELEEEGAEL